MTTKDFKRIYNNYAAKAASKSVNYSDLTRDEKITYLLSVVDVAPGTEIKSSKEIEIAKLSKDVRFELIQKATQEQNFELITRLATGVGSAEVVVAVPFEKAGVSAQLNFLEKMYKDENGNLPTSVEVDILGGDNFFAFIRFAYQMIESK